MTNFLPLKKSVVVPPSTRVALARWITVESLFTRLRSTGRDAPVMFETLQPIMMDFLLDGTVYTSTAVVPTLFTVLFVNWYVAISYPSAIAIATERLSI